MQRTRKRTLIVLGAAVLGLFALRFVLPLLLAWIHYSSTPDFRTWVRAHPTSDTVWQAVVREGTELGRGLPWRSNEAEPFERRGVWLVTTRADHGDEVLLDLELEVSVESREVEGWLERDVASEAFEGLAVRASRAELDPDFHAVVVLTLQDLTQLRKPQGPNMQVDVFVLSGPGEVEFVAQEASGSGPGRGDSLLGGGSIVPSSGVLRLLTGLVFSTDDPPEEGLAYHLRADFHPSWSRVDGGSHGPGLGQWEFGGTSAQYSFRLEGRNAVQKPFDDPGFFGSSSTSHVDVVYRWNGDVW